MSQLLYTVKEVFSDEDYLKNYGKDFYNIPLYQRGYKWEEKHVTKLLDDIDNFQEGDKKFYCLQNITIVPQDNFFNIVDGQQRLTTLTILLSYLQEKKLVNNKVRFPNNSIRKETNRFLNETITKEEIIFPEGDWEGFIKNSKEFDHQDIYHIFHVHKAIENWFETKENHLSFSRDKFRSKLLESVKLIINQIDDTTKSEEKIFGNLNSKRVPLDGADLVRAMLITRVAHEEGKREADIKNIVRVNERRVKIGWELDQINNWWSQDKIKNYFTRFIGITSENIGVGKKLFDEEKYPINILYLLFAEKRKEEKLSLELIEKHNNDALGLYKELIKLHSTLQDWYQDRQIYHFLGFLFAHKTKKDFNFGKLWTLWTSSVTRNEFIKKLKEKINDNFLVDGDIIDFHNQDINWYEEEPTKLVQALILMDIIHSIKENQSFLPASSFSKASNDIEHIFPQNPQKVEDKKGYITFLNENVVKSDEKFDLTGFEKNHTSETYIQKMDSFIEAQVSEFRIHSIGNLVLLYASLNRSISNNTYSKKRARIIQYFNNGHFIQPHTFQVFVRYFNNNQSENRDYEHWTKDDIEANALRISLEIKKFLNPKSYE